MFQVGISYADDIAYRPWVKIPASQGWITLESQRTLEAKASFHRGEICDVRQIRTQEGDEPMGEKVIFGTPHQSPRHLCLKLVTEFSFCVVSVKSGGELSGIRGKSSTVRELERKRSKRWTWSEVRSLVGYWCRKGKCGPRKGPLQLFPCGVVSYFKQHLLI